MSKRIPQATWSVETGPHVLVYCRSPRWWGQIRQARWVESHAWVRVLPHPDALLAEGLQLSQALSILELPSSDGESLLETVWRLATRRGLSRVACLAEPGQAGYEFAYREAGAVEFLTSVAEFGRVRRALTQHLQNLPPLRLPWEQAIIQQLPWRSLLP